MTKDYKDTAFRVSQMLFTIASFLHANKGIDIGVSEKDVRETAESLMEDVRELYNNHD